MAGSASSPSQETVIGDPLAAARVSTPMMLLPFTLDAVLLDVDLGAEAVRDLDELRRRAGVQPERVDDDEGPLRARHAASCLPWRRPTTTAAPMPASDGDVGGGEEPRAARQRDVARPPRPAPRTAPAGPPASAALRTTTTPAARPHSAAPAARSRSAAVGSASRASRPTMASPCRYPARKSRTRRPRWIAL